MSMLYISNLFHKYVYVCVHICIYSLHIGEIDIILSFLISKMLLLLFLRLTCVLSYMYIIFSFFLVFLSLSLCFLHALG